jgi:hypothetical protein
VQVGGVELLCDPLVEVLLELRFVLSSHPHYSGIEQLQRRCSWRLEYSALFGSVIDLEAVSLNKKQVRNVQFK